MFSSTELRTRLLYGLLFLSGASGLIGQVVWHKYLAILLGSEAQATSIVLFIFLGGIGLGYAVFGRWSRSYRGSLFFLVVLVELGLCLWAFLFPYLFSATLPLTSWLYRTFGLTNFLVDIGVSFLLIGFPTFLMGGTLPVLTQALSPSASEASGIHAKVYGFNTVGACFGALLGGYCLIPLTGLGVALCIAGLFNLIAAFGIYALYVKTSKSKARRKSASPPKIPARKLSKLLRVRHATLLAVGALSGFYVLSLETVLVRLMGLSTGSSNYNFTLIVAIFVFALGLGSLLARKINHYSIGHLLLNQVGVTSFLILLYLSGDYWPYFGHLARAPLRDIAENFYLYQLILALGASFLILIPISLCGLVLPLCFHLFKDRKETLGLKVGQLYGLNTLGTMIGALGSWLILNYINLDQLFKFCLFLSWFGLALTAHLYSREKKFKPAQSVMAGVALVLLVQIIWFLPLYSKENYLQPFRQHRPIEATFQGAAAFRKELSKIGEYLVYDDGPNTSVGIARAVEKGKEISRFLLVNGKSDGDTQGDFRTMTLTGLIPGLLSRDVGRTCIIGFGTGVTAGALARFQEVKQLEIIEISKTLARHASLFDPYTGNVTQNPKTRMHIMDAFRFFSGGDSQCDLIVSEPSNPWVVGVENLFGFEFYEMAKRRLSPNGMIAQWIQGYSFNDRLFKNILATLEPHFKWIQVFRISGPDFLVIASPYELNRADLERARQRLEANRKPWASDLKRMSLPDLETILGLEIVPAALIPSATLHSEKLYLEHPKLSSQAAVSFFTKESVRIVSTRRKIDGFYRTVDQSLLAKLKSKRERYRSHRRYYERYCLSGTTHTSYLCREAMAASRIADRRFLPGKKYKGLLSDKIWKVMERFHQPLNGKFESADLDETYEMYDLFKQFYSVIAPISLKPILRRTARCLAQKSPKSELYGKCLAHRLLILQATQFDAQQFRSEVEKYHRWLAQLPSTYSRYRDYRRLGDSLNRSLGTR